jgi:hypothetical protein
MFSEADAQVFEGLSEEDINLFVSTLEKIQTNIERQIERNHNP